MILFMITLVSVKVEVDLMMIALNLELIIVETSAAVKIRREEESVYEEDVKFDEVIESVEEDTVRNP